MKINFFQNLNLNSNLIITLNAIHTSKEIKKAEFMKRSFYRLFDQCRVCLTKERVSSQDLPCQNIVCQKQITAYLTNFKFAFRK